MFDHLFLFIRTHPKLVIFRVHVPCMHKAKHVVYVNMKTSSSFVSVSEGFTLVLIVVSSIQERAKDGSYLCGG